jgi:hypothetical protein
MPKDEFDFDDPMELTGVAMFTREDTTNEMSQCFIEEFLWMGYNHKQVLALFRNPHYVGPNLVLEKRGEEFVREQIAAVFAQWGKPVTWPPPCSSRREEAHSSSCSCSQSENQLPSQSLLTSAATEEAGSSLTDPMGAPIPKLRL